MLPSLRIKLLLLAATSLIALLVGFVLVPPDTAIQLVQHGGYFVILAATIAFAVSLVRWLRAPGSDDLWIRSDWRLAALCLGITLVWQFQGLHGFKILMDECVLAATSMSMHFNREVFVPLKTHDVNGIYAVLGGVVDKRPLFFPFLQSLLHDLTGYRSENVFWLNGVLSFLLLFLVGRAGRRLGRSEPAGYLAVLLLAGLPLLALNATGAGFEVLNLLMIVVVLILARRYLERPDEITLDVFVLSAVLLAQTRYESAAFMAAAGIVILRGWWQIRRPIVSWGLVATPLFLLPVPLIDKIFELNRAFWQVREGDDGPFGIGYVARNVGHAVEFLFTVDGFQMGSPVLSLFGLVCLLLLAVHIARERMKMLREPDTLSFVVIGATVLGNFVLLMFYHWGQLDDLVAARLGLPLLLLFALGSAHCLGLLIKRPGVWTGLLGVTVAWGFLGGIPITARSEANLTFLTFREVEWQRQFIRSHAGERNLYALSSSLPAIIEREPTLTVWAMNERSDQMAYHVEKKTYGNVWVFQRIEIDPETLEQKPDVRTKLGPEFILETVEERRLKPLTIERLSRLVAVDLTKREPRPPDWRPGFPPFEFNITDQDPSPNGVFMREFLRNLP